MTRLRIWCVCFAMFAFPASVAFGQGGFGEADADGDGKVSASELETYVQGKLTDFDKFEQLMAKLDTDKNGSLSEAEFENRMTAVQAIMQGGEETTQQRPARRGRRGQRGPEEGALKVGDEAPTFKLKSLDGESETDLAEFKGEKPVVLIFGSYT